MVHFLVTDLFIVHDRGGWWYDVILHQYATLDIFVLQECVQPGVNEIQRIQPREVSSHYDFHYPKGVSVRAINAVRTGSIK